MSARNNDIGLLLVGAGPRLAVVAIIVLALWAGFFWVTGQGWPASGGTS